MSKTTWRRLLALALVLVMAVSLVACGKKTTTEEKKEDTKTETVDKQDDKKEEEKTEEPADVTTESGVIAGNTDVTAEDILARDFSKPIEISFAGIQVTDGLDYNNSSEYYSWWSETFNVTWDVTSLSFANWVERLNVWINADDLPDWAVWNFVAGDAANYADQELVKRMDDDWKEKYPNLAAAASCAEGNSYYENLYGGMYFFFRPVFATNFPAETITNHMSMTIRKDWAEQAGFDLTNILAKNAITLTEFLDYCQAIKDAGIVEYPWYNTSGSIGTTLDKVAEATGAGQSPYFKGEDGKYHWGPAEESTGIKAALGQIKEAYDNGLLYPEFYTLQTEDDKGHFNAAGDAAAVLHEGMAAWMDRFDTAMTENLGVSYWDTSVTLVLTDDNGVAHDDPSQNFWACNIISPNIEDDTLERLLTIWDYGCTEEGQLRIRLGVPEVDWTKDANGELVSTFPQGEYATLEAKYTSQYPILGNMFILSDDYSFISPAFTKNARERVAELYLTRSDLASTKGQPVDWDLASYSSQALNLASMTYADEYANLITKEGDFSANYDQWVAEKMSLIQPVLDELNAAFGE